MRYYDLVISNAEQTSKSFGQVYKPELSKDAPGFALSAGGSTFTSWVKGPVGMQTDPGALNIEFDMPVTAQHEPQGKQWIRIWGIGLKMISQSADLNGQAFKLSGGMKPGLPLANPAQAGLLASGVIYQAFGNWEGVNQTLDLVVNPGGLEPKGGIAFDWPAGTPLSHALKTTFTQAFPQYTTDINISPNYIQPHQEAGGYDSFTQFAQYINRRTTALGMKIYGRQAFQGVAIIISGTRIVVFDQTTISKTVQLNFVDLIGQPTWIETATISFKTVLRADISVGDTITFPKGVVAPFVLTTSGAAAPNVASSSKIVFQGKFKVREIHHYANYRQPEGQAWCTSFTASPVPVLGTTLLTSSLGL